MQILINDQQVSIDDAELMVPSTEDSDGTTTYTTSYTFDQSAFESTSGQLGYRPFDETKNEQIVVCRITHRGATGPTQVSAILGLRYVTSMAELTGNETIHGEKKVVVLTCSANGIPQPNDDDYRIERRKGTSEPKEEWELVIRSQIYTTSEEGEYRCSVTNQPGQTPAISKSYIFDNDLVPDEHDYNLSVTAVDGSAAVLHCAQNADRNRPSPTIRVDTFDDVCFWMHGDSTAIFSHRLSDNPGYQILFDGGKILRQCALIIYKVNTEHEGDWYCNIGNGPRHMVQLNVTDRIGGHQPDVSAIQGSSVVLPCHLRNTNRLCYWTHGNVTVMNRSSQNSDERIQIITDPNEGNCDLLIQNIQEKDGGHWYCHIFGNGPIKLELEVKTNL